MAPAAGSWPPARRPGWLNSVDRTSREDFAGTERYVIQRCLGRGGFGVVYEAFDRQQNAIVALKTLHRGGADALYRFKREFRALADISHPKRLMRIKSAGRSMTSPRLTTSVVCHIARPQCPRASCTASARFFPC